MLFGLNYSPQAARLLQQGQIAIDRFKCPPWPDLVDEARGFAPVYVHFDLVVGSGRAAETDWASIDHFLHLTETPCVNVHLAPRYSNFPGSSEQLTDAARADIIDTMIRDVALFAEHYGAERIMVENIPYRADGSDARPCVEPDVFRAVLESTGARMLFDISHARIAAHHLGMDAHAYIDALPLERVQELHITGIHTLDGVLTDHLDLQAEDWDYFDWVMGKIARGACARPWIGSFEYGGVTDRFNWRSREDVIAAQVPRMVQAICALPAA
jgi:hypothetical protein